MAVSDTLLNTLFDGRYRIVRKLGTGGMANVYLAEDEVLGRRVAIKILNDRHAGDDQFVERFRREAKNAASLSHPNIVSIYDRGEAEGTYYIAMEYLDGRSLKELIVARGPAPIHLAVDYARQILAALALRAPARHRPPRHQAAQRARRRRGTLEGDGLRHRARGREPDDRGRLDHRDGAVPVAGAGEGCVGRPDLGSLFRRRRALRAADRRRAVQRRHAGRDRDEAPLDRAGAAFGEARRDSAGPRHGRDARPREGSLRALPERRGDGRGPAAHQPRRRDLPGHRGGGDGDHLAAAPTAVTAITSHAPTPTCAVCAAGRVLRLRRAAASRDLAVDRRVAVRHRRARRRVLPLLAASGSAQRLEDGRGRQLRRAPRDRRRQADHATPVCGRTRSGSRMRDPASPRRTSSRRRRRPGDRIQKSNFVTIYVSTGPPKTAVPSVVGRADRPARLSDLQDAKLKGRQVTVDSDKPQGQVISQSPKAGASVAEGTSSHAQRLEGAARRSQSRTSSGSTFDTANSILSGERIRRQADGRQVGPAEGHGHRHEPDRRHSPTAGSDDHADGLEGADDVHGSGRDHALAERRPGAAEGFGLRRAHRHPAGHRPEPGRDRPDPGSARRNAGGAGQDRDDRRRQVRRATTTPGPP